MSWDVKVADGVREHVPLSIHVLDLEGRLVDLNRAGGELFQGAAAGQSFFDHLHEADRARATEHFGRARTGETITFASRTAGGREITATFAPIASPVGWGIERVLGIAREVTAASQLAVSEARQRLLLSRTSDFVFAQDAGLRYTFVVNAPPGADGTDMVGKTDEDLLPPDEAEILEELKNLVLSGGAGQEREVRLTFGEEPRLYSLAIAPWRELTGRVAGVIGFARDVTRTRQAEDERERLRRELDRREQGALQRAGLIEEIGRSVGAVLERAAQAHVQAGPDSAGARALAEAINAAQRAAMLVDQARIDANGNLSGLPGMAGPVLEPTHWTAPWQPHLGPPPIPPFPPAGPPPVIFPMGPPPRSPSGVHPLMPPPPFMPPPGAGSGAHALPQRSPSGVHALPQQPPAPPAPAPQPELTSPPRNLDALRGDGIVLIADADPELRTQVGRALLQFGYRVLFAGTAQTALETLTKHHKVIRGIVLDASLPGLDASSTVGQVIAIKQDVALVLSGPSGDEGAFADRPAHARRLKKPYDPVALAEKLKESLLARSYVGT